MDLNYLKVASHRDLSGKDRYLYRFFEIIPGSLTWLTILGIVYFSWKTPVAAAGFLIVLFILGSIIRECKNIWLLIGNRVFKISNGIRYGSLSLCRCTKKTMKWFRNRLRRYAGRAIPKKE